jgi:UDP-2-acetamido-2-deoxy-ribo-hexuluronate aminotransferase
MEFIDLKQQYAAYKNEIDEAIREVFSHGRFIMGPEVAKLEEDLARYVGTAHCVTTASGTDSLEIALRALGIGPGDEVITVPFTWISTAEVIEQVGATTVFIDIEPDTFNMDMSKLREAITAKTRAIIPVSLFGQIADLERANDVAREFGIVVIEDGAQSFGATVGGKKSCSLTAIASTSFFPAKPFGCYGDGGALFTSDDGLCETMKMIRNHGGARRHHHTLVGMNGRFDTIQAATLLAKLPYFQDEVERRAVIGQRYSDSLENVCNVPEIGEGKTHVYGQYTIRVPKRESFMALMKEKGIPTAVYYPKCLHEQPVFEKLGYKRGSFPHSEKASEDVVSLPMHPFLTEKDQNRVIHSAKKALEQN